MFFYSDVEDDLTLAICQKHDSNVAKMLHQTLGIVGRKNSAAQTIGWACNDMPQLLVPFSRNEIRNLHDSAG